MTAPRLERIRPCLRCGALMTWSTLRCGACGAKSTAAEQAGAAVGDERVRPCLQCGVILRFDQDPCPRCGARARDGDEADRVKTCVECGEMIAFGAIYCPRCHGLSLPVATDSIPPDISLTAQAGFRDWAALAFGGAAVVLGWATVVVAFAEIAT
jgi:RNA polymerase subunit RPABC4/transcription elongation factor Spt4